MKSFIHNNFGRGNKNGSNDNKRKKLNTIYTFLTMGLDYNSIIENCPYLTEEELNWILWYFASRGLRYIPTLS